MAKARKGKAKIPRKSKQKDRVQLSIEDLKHKDAGIRRAATSFLGESRDPRAGRALLGALNDSDARVRASAARSLGMLRYVSAVKPVMKALGDSSSIVRLSAMWALGKLGDKSALPALRKLLKKESNPTRRLLITQTIKEITG